MATTTRETVEKIEEGLGKGCSEFGLDICVKIQCGWYNEVAPSTAPLLIEGKGAGDEVSF